ncbi:MAG: helix-turn-helix domain-containing protein [Paracoccaceae bacterium]|nr:helix-turn-helix domain-containing protein [Paracoccaceae bacterium]
MKRHQIYTVWEAAEAVGVHRQTVIRWIKDKGLSADTSQRPWLIEGREFKAFLEERRVRGKCRLLPGQIFCLPCRSPKNPEGRIAEFHLKTSTTGALIGICPDCGRLMHRFVGRADLDQIRAQLDVTISKAVPRLVEPDEPNETVTLKQEARTHGKAQRQ